MTRICEKIPSITLRSFFAALFLIFVISPNSSNAACSNPAGGDGSLVYNVDYSVLQFCDGTSWHGLGDISLNSTSIMTAGNYTDVPYEYWGYISPTLATLDGPEVMGSITGNTFINGERIEGLVYAENSGANEGTAVYTLQAASPSNTSIEINGTGYDVTFLGSFDGFSIYELDPSIAFSSGSTYTITGGIGISGAGSSKCANPEMSESSVYFNSDESVYLYCNGSEWVALGAPSPSAGQEECSNPSMPKGSVFYNSDVKRHQYCNGDQWIGFILANGGTSGSGGGGSCLGSGTRVGGYCWFIGAQNESCTQVCANAGGMLMYDPATLSYAGSGGSLAQCEGVLDALGVGTGSPVSMDCSPDALGCAYDPTTPARVHCSSPATTEGAAGADWARACACYEFT